MRQRPGQKNTDNGSWKEVGGREQEHIIIAGKLKLVSVSIEKEHNTPGLSGKYPAMDYEKRRHL